jgi:toluene monooxygenase system protein E
LYYPGRGFEVPTPIAAWYERHQLSSRLTADWQTFADPRETTYASYVAEQHERECFVDQILRSIEETGYDRELDSSWVDVLEVVLPVLRFPIHGLSMLVCYIGHMAPEGRLVVACAFQAMDEMRRVQRLAYRMRQLMDLRPGFGVSAKREWEQAAAWQPLRQVLERLLVTYDFGESSVATLLVLKPAFDALFMRGFARLAVERGDRLLFELLSSLDRDCAWHADWAAAFVEAALVERPDNAAVIAEWILRWWPEVRAAISAGIGLMNVPPERAAALAHAVEVACAQRWALLGVTPDGR